MSRVFLLFTVPPANHNTGSQMKQTGSSRSVKRYLWRQQQQSWLGVRMTLSTCEQLCQRRYVSAGVRVLVMVKVCQSLNVGIVWHPANDTVSKQHGLRQAFNPPALCFLAVGLCEATRVTEQTVAEDWSWSHFLLWYQHWLSASFCFKPWSHCDTLVSLFFYLLKFSSLERSDIDVK